MSRLNYKSEIKQVDVLFLAYRVTTSKEGETTVETCTEFPGLKIQYSRDNGQTWNNMSSSQPRLPDENVLLRTL